VSADYRLADSSFGDLRICSVLREIKASGKTQNYAVPETLTAQDFVLYDPPKDSDPYVFPPSLPLPKCRSASALNKIAQPLNHLPPYTLCPPPLLCKIVPLSFYIATDERNATVIAYMRDHGAVFVSDLLTAQDRRELAAWPLVFTEYVSFIFASIPRTTHGFINQADTNPYLAFLLTLLVASVLGVMEQTLLARSSYFYAHALSSVSGGAINHRGSLGKDPRTTKID
jgi:hypothetical protein